MDEGESKDTTKYKKQLHGIVKDIIADVSNVFQSIRIRYTVQNCFGLDRFILENRYNFLFHFNSILFILFVLKFKK